MKNIMVLAVRQRGLNALKRADGERANDAGERMETADTALYSGSEGFKRKGGYTMSRSNGTDRDFHGTFSVPLVC